MATTIYFRNEKDDDERIVGSFFTGPKDTQGPEGTRRQFQCDIEDKALLILFCHVAHSIPVFIDNAGNTYTGNDLLPYVEENK